MKLIYGINQSDKKIWIKFENLDEKQYASLIELINIYRESTETEVEEDKELVL